MADQSLKKGSQAYQCKGDGAGYWWEALEPVRPVGGGEKLWLVFVHKRKNKQYEFPPFSHTILRKGAGPAFVTLRIWNIRFL